MSDRVLSHLLPVVFLCLSAARVAPAQPAAPCDRSALNLTVRNVGLSIGDSRRTTGVRLNYRDRCLERVNGVNLTLWEPVDTDSDAAGSGRGTVNGVAVGLPLTGAERIHGLALGGGIATSGSLYGLSVGALGAASGDHLHGIVAAGLGVGAGSDVAGLVAGGLGVGAGDRARGVLVGGLGVGAGTTASGVLIGGLGAGAGEEASGILVGGQVLVQGPMRVGFSSAAWVPEREKTQPAWLWGAPGLGPVRTYRGSSSVDLRPGPGAVRVGFSLEASGREQGDPSTESASRLLPLEPGRT